MRRTDRARERPDEADVSVEEDDRARAGLLPAVVLEDVFQPIEHY